MKVKALNNFGYPASQTVRNRIRSGEKIPHEDRGRIVEVKSGETVEAPSDLAQGWLDAELVEDASTFADPPGEVNDGLSA